LFPKLLVVMVRIGESTGHLGPALLRVAAWLEQDDKLRQRLKSSLSYPAFILTLAFGITMALFSTTIPTFAKIFEEMHAQLPLITQLVLGFPRLIRNPGFWLLFASLAFAVYDWLQRTWAKPEGAAFLFSILSHI